MSIEPLETLGPARASSRFRLESARLRRALTPIYTGEARPDREALDRIRRGLEQIELMASLFLHVELALELGIVTLGELRSRRGELLELFDAEYPSFDVGSRVASAPEDVVRASSVPDTVSLIRTREVTEPLFESLPTLLRLVIESVAAAKATGADVNDLERRARSVSELLETRERRAKSLMDRIDPRGVEASRDAYSRGKCVTLEDSLRWPGESS